MPLCGEDRGQMFMALSGNVFYLLLSSYISFYLLLFYHESADVDDGHHGLLHALDGDELVTSVEVQTTCEDVGAGESFEAELSAICAASDGHNVAETTSLLDSLLGNFRHLRFVLQLAQHIIILVLHFGLNCPFSVLGVQLLCKVENNLLAALEDVAVVVANDV